jgi:hypothetical protein
MFPSHLPQQAALACELVTALADYETGLRRLLHAWDADLYRELSDQFDRMQLMVPALPQLTLGWTELLISRAELMHALWTVGPERSSGKVIACHAQHEAVLRDVVRKCLPYAAPLQ